MNTTGTHIAYLHLCHRKLWLFAHGLNQEQHSELVAEGRQIDAHSYAERAGRWQALAIEGIKIDHYDARCGIVREVKKSKKREDAHTAQLKYYLFVLERNGIAADHGLLEYPKLRQTQEVRLSEADRRDIPLWEAEVQGIVSRSDCPPLVKKAICKKCAYYEWCYVG